MTGAKNEALTKYHGKLRHYQKARAMGAQRYGQCMPKTRKTPAQCAQMRRAGVREYRRPQRGRKRTLEHFNFEML